MDILKNPFHILGATTRDNRHNIMELAEERSLLSDADECMEARSILTRPRRRIAAEVAWLPGIDPTLSDIVLRNLDSPNQNLLNITAPDAYRPRESACLWVIASSQPLGSQHRGMDTHNRSSL